MSLKRCTLFKSLYFQALLKNPILQNGDTGKTITEHYVSFRKASDVGGVEHFETVLEAIAVNLKSMLEECED